MKFNVSLWQIHGLKTKNKCGTPASSDTYATLFLLNLKH